MLQVAERARDGAVELFVRGGNAQGVLVLLQQFQHEGIATGEVVQAIGRVATEEDILARQDDAVLDARQVAAPAVLLGAEVDAVLPLVPGSLFHEVVSGEVAAEVDGLRDQRVAAGAHRAVEDVLALLRPEADEELHDRLVDHVVRVGAIDLEGVVALGAAEEQAGAVG